jgi:RNA polymerase sigma factor (sigma-70 family)
LLEKKLWLTCDETEAFFRRLTKWEAAFLEARSALVIAHQRLVPFCANRFRESSMAFEDLVQEGFVALTMAVENYQPHVSKFSTFASKVIHSAMIRAIDEQGHLIRIPVHACEKIRKIRKQSEALQKDLGRDATDSEIAFACNLPSEKVRELRAAAQKPLSLDAPRENPEETDADSIYEPSTPRDNANPPPDEHSEGSLRVVNERLGRLAPEHREIVERIFGLGGSEACSVQEAAPLFGKTERQIRAILSKAFTVMAAHAPKPAPASAAEATTEPAVEPVAGGSDPLADAHMLGIAA